MWYFCVRGVGLVPLAHSRETTGAFQCCNSFWQGNNRHRFDLLERALPFRLVSRLLLATRINFPPPFLVDFCSRQHFLVNLHAASPCDLSSAFVERLLECQGNMLSRCDSRRNSPVYSFAPPHTRRR